MKTARDHAEAFMTLDLFSAAAGGWTLGMERAGFVTVAACESEAWRRALYAENNPEVLLYDDVRTLTADRVRTDLGAFPDIVVGSPPCQDISSANTKGKGVDGERSILFFEAVRIIGEGRPRWFALENSSNLRTRGADRVLGALEELGYACWAFVVGGDNIRANHERKRSWLIGCDLAQLAHPHGQGEHAPPFYGQVAELRRLGGDRSGEATDTDGLGRDEGRSRRRLGVNLPAEANTCDTAEDGRGPGLPGRRAGAIDEPEEPPCRDDVDAAGLGHEGRRPRGRGADGNGASSASGGAGNPPNPDQARQARQARQAHGCVEPGIRQEEIANDGRGSRRGDDGPGAGQVGLCEADRLAALQHRADWSLDDLARHIRLDDGLPAWVAQSRIAVGGPRGAAAASLIVEAFGDAVLPQIPEAIGRAILRTEAALAAVYTRAAA